MARQQWLDVIAAARLRLVRERPYLAAALFAMKPVASTGPSMAVDERWNLYVDPSQIGGWSVEEVAGVLYHEVLHLLRNHHQRLRDLPYDVSVLNVAADYEVNDDLVAEGVPLPGRPLLPWESGFPAGLTAEQYAELLARNEERGAASPRAGSAGGRGEGGDDGQSMPGPYSAGSEQQADRGEWGEGGQGNASPGGAVERERCDQWGAGGGADRDEGSDQGSAPGSAARERLPEFGGGSGSHGRPQPWEVAEGGVGSVEAELIRRAVARAIEEELARGRGDIPGHLRRWVEARRSRRDWRKSLRAMVRSALAEVRGAVEYRYGRLSRRQSVVPWVVLPGLVEPQPVVAVVVDTSGSMGDGRLARAVSEVEGVVRAVGAVPVIACDVAATVVGKSVRSVRQVRELVGGGGTDMRVGLEVASRLRPRPDVVVVLTDGFTPWPERPPRGVRVVVGLVGERGRDRVPDWARVVEIG